MIVISANCSQRKSELVWNKDLYIIGSQSSPRAADLNDDGVLDIVMGAGKNEFQDCDQGIIALNGENGELLWQQSSTDQVYGSATFLDINDDGTDDVFIGGRTPAFKALNGKTGEVIWAYNHQQYSTHPVLQYARFNFSNSVLVPDQTQDNIPDLLVINGGNAKAGPGSEKDRFPGVLMLFDSKSGKIIASDTMPDGKESYMSPVCFLQPEHTDPTIIFGTGGETIDGHLYMAKLSDLMTGKLSGATIIAHEKQHGFVAPPSIADINGDKFYDVVAISHGSTAFAVNGKNGEALWKQAIPNTESSNSFAVGYFNHDDVPDFFTFVSKGMWPNSAGSIQVMLDGKDGHIAFQDSLGCTGFSSPVVYDLNNDGQDEAIISINEFDCTVGFAGKTPSTMQNKIVAIDFLHQNIQIIDQSRDFKNIFSTPWLGDLDDDGYLDIVHCQYYHRGDLLKFLGMKVKRIETPVRVRRNPVWGAYMGSAGNGIFPVEESH